MLIPPCIYGPTNYEYLRSAIWSHSHGLGYHCHTSRPDGPRGDVLWFVCFPSETHYAAEDLMSACVFMYITASAPSKRSLGAINGLSQTMVSFARAVGPALSTSLFSISVEQNILGGYAVYAILFIFSGLALLLAAKLPGEMWEEHDDEIIHL